MKAKAPDRIFVPEEEWSGNKHDAIRAVRSIDSVAPEEEAQLIAEYKLVGVKRVTFTRTVEPIK